MPPSMPKWADDVRAVQDYIFSAQMELMNVPSYAGHGYSTHVGIIDSRSSISDNLTDGHRVYEGDSNCFIGTNKQQTQHANNVFNQVSAVAPEAKFSIYRAINEKGKIQIEAFSEAVSKALDDGVDIVNISAGDPWPGPIKHSPLAQETKRLLNGGVTVVAAAGNHFPEKQDSKPPVHSPAALRDVIAVGGFVSECPQEPGDEAPGEPNGPYYLNPGQDDPDACTGVYCGEQGCVDGAHCISNQIESPWDGNPLPTDNKPDVLAPMHIIEPKPDSPRIIEGTSFSAPLVTGALASIYDDLRAEGDEMPSPGEARDAVRNGAATIGPSGPTKYDDLGTRSLLGAE